jgi:thymidine phosphorylase
MSRKLAEGLDGVVVDVKVGQGGLVRDAEAGRRLGQAMVRIGNAMGVKTVAVITNMEQPIGMAIGSSLEMRECLTALRGRWSDDLKEVTLTLGAWMIKTASKVADFVFVHRDREYGGLFDYRDGLLELLKDGTAREKFLELVAAQRGSLLSRAKQILLPKASLTRSLQARRAGYVRRLNGEKAGIAVGLLGGARKTLHDAIDHAAGIVLMKKVGDYVEAGQPIAVLHYGSGAEVEAAEEVFLSGIEIGREEIEPREPIIGVIQ